MLARVAFGMAIVLATASGSLAGSHGKKSYGYLPNRTSAASIPAPSERTIFGLPPSEPTILGWPVPKRSGN